MPTLDAYKISRIASAVMRGAGASEEYAKIVGDHLADASLAGHDSHGFIRVIQYVRDVRNGWLDPGAHPVVTKDSQATAHVNGNRAFGQVTASFAANLARDKALEFGVSLVSICNMGHMGRIGAYPEMLAKEGMASIMCFGVVGGRMGRTAPFGGREGRLGTNPISMAFPSATESPVVLDFATSVVAEGKLRVQRARGELLPEEWVIDRQGVPSRDPNDYYDGGALLPMGGLVGGYKGYALSLMIALFGTVLAEVTCPEVGEEGARIGASIMAIDVARIAPLEAVQAEARDVVSFVKDVAPMQGSRGVLHPGEIEATTRRERSETGVVVEQSTWDEVVGLVDEFGVRDELADLLAG